MPAQFKNKFWEQIKIENEGENDFTNIDMNTKRDSGSEQAGRGS